jgi:hypothetical protein
MAVKKVNDGIPAPSKGAPQTAPSLVDVLTRVGLLSGGKDPLKVAAQLLGNLVAKGFGAGVGNVEAALKTSIAAFQRAQGLPVTGQLDAATANAMNAQGLLPGQGVHQFQDGFEKRPPKTTIVDDAAKKQNAALGGLAAKLSEAIGSVLGGLFGQKAPAPTTEGKGQGPSESPAGDKKGGATDGGTTTASGHAAQQSSSEKARSDGRGFADPTMRGVREGDVLAERGRAALGEKAGTTGGGEEAKGARKKTGVAGSATDGDDDGTEDHRGNASSGDEAFDEREGHASLDDESASERGHWRVPAVDVQAQRLLDAIRREPEVENRAAAYSLDVRFYRPGVYGAGQKGDEILHVVVTGASALDPTWEKVVARVTALVEQHAPGRVAPDLDDFKAALRVARYRSE